MGAEAGRRFRFAWFMNFWANSGVAESGEVEGQSPHLVAILQGAGTLDIVCSVFSLPLLSPPLPPPLPPHHRHSFARDELPIYGWMGNIASYPAGSHVWVCWLPVGTVVSPLGLMLVLAHGDFHLGWPASLLTDVLCPLPYVFFHY
jgi:hypothetical protein